MKLQPGARTDLAGRRPVRHAIPEDLRFRGLTPQPYRPEHRRYASLRTDAVLWLDAGSYSGTGALQDLSGNGLHAQQGSSAGADTNDPLWCPPPAPAAYWQGTGVAGNYGSTPLAGAVAAETTEVVVRTQFRSSGNPGICGFRNQAGITLYDGMPHYCIRPANGVDEWQSFAVPPAVNGQWIWLRARRTRSTGLVEMWWAADQTAEPSSWTSLGSKSGTAGDLYASPEIQIGRFAQSYYADFGIGQTFFRKAGVTVASFDPTTMSAQALTGTDAQGNVWTVTQSASGRKAQIIDRAGFLFGTDDFMEIADNDLLDFGAMDSFTVVAAARVSGAFPSYNRLVSKESGAWPAVGWCLTGASGYRRASLRWADGIISRDAYLSDASADFTDGQMSVFAGVRDAATRKAWHWRNGVASAMRDDTTTTTLANGHPVRIGAAAYTSGGYADMFLTHVAIFRRALTAAELAALASYWGVS